MMGCRSIYQQLTLNLVIKGLVIYLVCVCLSLFLLSLVSNVDIKIGLVSSPTNRPAPFKRESLFQTTLSMFPQLPHGRLVKTLKNPCWLEDAHTSDSEEAYMNNPYKNTFDTYFLRLFMKDKRRMPRHKLRCVPYFYISGMQKCGTTELWSLLTSHPDILAGGAKESLWWERRSECKRKKPFFCII